MTYKEVVIYDDLIETVMVEEKLRQNEYDSTTVYQAVMFVLDDAEIARKRYAELVYEESLHR